MKKGEGAEKKGERDRLRGVERENETVRERDKKDRKEKERYGREERDLKRM